MNTKPSHNNNLRRDVGHAPSSYAVVKGRVIGIVLLTAFAVYAMLYIRGSTTGLNLIRIVVSTAIVGALVAIPATIFPLGLNLRSLAGILFGVMAVATTISELRCGIEESRFVHNNRNTLQETVFQDRRWWPNENASLYYKPATGTVHAGD